MGEHQNTILPLTAFTTMLPVSDLVAMPIVPDTEWKSDAFQHYDSAYDSTPASDSLSYFQLSEGLYFEIDRMAWTRPMIDIK